MKNAALFCLIALCLPVLAQKPWNQTFREDAPVPREVRSNRTSYSPLMEMLRPARPEVTDEQLEQLAAMQVENIWEAMGEYRDTNYVRGFQTTQPDKRLVGRALTMRYLPPRPDLKGAAERLAAEGDWDPRFNIRAGEESRAGDVIVVEQGGPEGSIFLGDLTALGMAMRGAAGALVDGGVRDVAELRGPDFEDFPVFARFFDARANWWVGTDWNVPIRVGDVTVIPGDIVVADEVGALFVPPQLVAPILRESASTKRNEHYQRKLIQQKRYRIRDVYPLQPALEQEFERQP